MKTVLALAAGASALVAPAAPKAQRTVVKARITELKHGRVAMAGFVGYLVPEVYKWPGYLSPTNDLKFEDVPNGLNALPVVPGLGWFQMIMVVGWLEAGPFAATRSEFA